MDKEYIDPDEPCLVDVAYRCTGKPLHIDMENTLAFMIQDKGVQLGGRFSDGHRIAQFKLKTRTDAENFCRYVKENYSDAKTTIVIDYHD